MESLTANPVFGLLLTLVAGSLGVYIRNRSAKLWVNPMLLSVIIIVAFLSILDIPYSNYKVGGDIINMFLGPITVLLAIPLYENRSFLRKYFKAIMSGVIVGSLSALISVFVFSKLLNLDDYIMNSILGRSVTTPIGIAIANMLDANESIVILAISITGIFTILIVPFVYKIFRITHPIAKGVALGTGAHAIGTAKAMEMGKIEGAMGALSIGLAGLVTVIWVIVFSLIGVL